MSNKVCIKDSNYCRCGLGATDSRCFECKPQVNIRREGGPGIAAELEKVWSAGSVDPGLLIPDSVKSKTDLSEFLQKQGYKRGSDEYWKYYKQYSEVFKNLI